MAKRKRIYHNIAYEGNLTQMTATMTTTLLIEDNAQNSYLVTFLLEKNGYKVIHSLDGLKAIEVAKTTAVDLILLDIQLPSMDGYSVARAIREIDKLKTIPIIAVTSYAMVGDREKAVAAGCNGYLEKPIDPDTFISSIERIIAADTNKKERK
jgi:two-component system cell cycle response regulator DivK